MTWHFLPPYWHKQNKTNDKNIYILWGGCNSNILHYWLSMLRFHFTNTHFVKTFWTGRTDGHARLVCRLVVGVDVAVTRAAFSTTCCCCARRRRARRILFSSLSISSLLYTLPHWRQRRSTTRAWQRRHARAVLGVGVDDGRPVRALPYLFAHRRCGFMVLLSIQHHPTAAPYLLGDLPASRFTYPHTIIPFYFP